MAPRVDGEHVKALREQRRQGVEAARVVEHAVGEHDRRARRVAPLVHAQADAEREHVAAALGRYGARVRGRRAHGGTQGTGAAAGPPPALAIHS